MHGHDGCGCGHAHGAPEQEQVLMQEEAGCGEGCGCAHGEGALDAVQIAALRGFLSGIYATQLDADGLADYLAAMGRQDGSEFQEGARFLADQFEAVRATADGEEEPPAWTLLDAVAADEEE